MQENSFDSAINDTQDELRLRYRLYSTKDSRVMQQECHDRVVRRKRLTVAQGMWLYNRYINSFNHANATWEPHNSMVDELREAQSTIQKLQHRIEELEGSRL